MGNKTDSSVETEFPIEMEITKRKNQSGKWEITVHPSRTQIVEIGHNVVNFREGLVKEIRKIVTDNSDAIIIIKLGTVLFNEAGKVLDEEFSHERKAGIVRIDSS